MAASHPECNSQKVLIIGAGIGGLVTAQILHRFDIQFEIFERAEDLWLERRGWAVGLMEYSSPLNVPLLARYLTAS